MGTPNPTVNWTASTGAQGYEVTVYEEDGTTVKCASAANSGHRDIRRLPDVHVDGGFAVPRQRRGHGGHVPHSGGERQGPLRGGRGGVRSAGCED